MDRDQKLQIAQQIIARIEEYTTIFEQYTELEAKASSSDEDILINTIVDLSSQSYLDLQHKLSEMSGNARHCPELITKLSSIREQLADQKYAQELSGQYCSSIQK